MTGMHRAGRGLRNSCLVLLFDHYFHFPFEDTNKGYANGRLPRFGNVG